MRSWRSRSLGSRIILCAALALPLFIALCNTAGSYAPGLDPGQAAPFSWFALAANVAAYLALLSVSALLLGFAVAASQPIAEPAGRVTPAPSVTAPLRQPSLRNLRSWSAASMVLTFSAVCLTLTIGLCGYGPHDLEPIGNSTKMQELAGDWGYFAFMGFLFSLLLGLLLWAARTHRRPR